MRALDLFSGIGGIALAAEWAGIETAAFCEIEPYCRRVLARHWPGVPIYEDVRKLTRERLEKDGVMDDVRTIDIVLGGYPCQPFSTAGKRRGKADDRHLWPEMFRLIRELRPAWVVGENVAGHVSLGLDDVLDDLESEGYTCRAFVLPAAAVGAPHRRERVFIVAHADIKYSDDGGHDSSEMGRERSEATDLSGGKSMAYTSRQLPYGSGDARRRRAEYPNGGQDVADSEGGGFHNRNDSPYIGEANRKINSSDNSSDFGRKGEALADTERAGSEKRNTSAFTEESRPYSGAIGANGGDWTTQPRMGRDVDGFSGWLDRTRWPAAFGEPQHEWEPPRVAVGIKNRVPRLKALGNAVVPQQVYPILRAIREAHERRRER